MKIQRLPKSRSDLQILSRLVTIAAVIPAWTSAALAEPTVKLGDLAAGAERTVEVSGPARHTYQLALLEDSYTRIVVEQDGVDVYLLWRSPAGEVLVEEDSPNEFRGPEPLHVIAAETGEYELEVVHGGEESGNYRLRVERLAPADPTSRRHVEAQRLFLESQSRLYSRWDLARLRGSIAGFQRALDLFRQLGDVIRESQTLHAIGHAFGRIGEPERAERYLLEALELRRKLGDSEGEAKTLGSLGSGLVLRGRPSEAVRLLSQAYALHTDHRDAVGVTIVSNNLADAYLDLGELHQALEAAFRAQHFAELTHSVEDQGLAAKYLAEIYSRLGDDEQALRHLETARRHFGDAGALSPGLPVVDIMSGQILALRGDPEAAKAALGGALQMLALRYRPGYARTLVELGKVELRLGEIRQATSHLSEAVDVWQELGSLREEGRARTMLAEVLGESGQPDSWQLLEEALRSSRKTGDRRGELMALVAASRYQQRRGRQDQALSYAMKAADLALALRDSQDWARIREAHSVARAEQSPEARHFGDLELDRARSGFHAGQRPVFEALVGLLSELARDDPAAEARSFALSERARSSGLASSLVDVPRVAGDVPGLDELRALIGRDSTFLGLLLGESRSFLWLVGAREVEVATLPGRRALEGQATALLKRLRHPASADFRALAHRLGETLFGSLDGFPESGRVVFAPDGVLNQIPLAALGIPGRDGYVPFVEQYEVVSVPSAAALRALRERRAARPDDPRGLVIFADPAFPTKPGEAASQDPSSQACSDRLWQQLPGTALEAAAIARLLESDYTTRFSGPRATLAALRGSEVRSAAAVHLATHGFFDPDSPILGGLVLLDSESEGQARCLSVADTYGLDLRAEIVTLSACDTARGRLIGGEGSLGLPRAFLLAGASAVVSSLWRSHDEATRKLMADYYEAMIRYGQSPAAALRDAQRRARRDSSRAPAFFWAGFVFQGDWTVRPFREISGGH